MQTLGYHGKMCLKYVINSDTSTSTSKLLLCSHNSKMVGVIAINDNYPPAPQPPFEAATINQCYNTTFTCCYKTAL